MKTVLISFLIGCVGVATVNAIRPIENIQSSVILTFVFVMFAYVYISLWENRKRRKK